MTGLAAARRLHEAGFAVTIFDKSRGTGGRLATRRSGRGAFDHGAEAVHAGGVAEFDAAMERLGATRTEDGGWRGEPGMSALLKPWLGGIDHVARCRIAKLHGRSFVDQDGTAFGPFHARLIAIPAPQALALTGQEALRLVTMSPVWTVLAGWTEAGADMGGVEPPLERVIRQPGGGALWVAHASEAWSRDNLEREKPDVADELLTSLAKTLCREDPPVHLAAHRWRYARVRRTLGRPFLDCGNNVLAGGDWAMGRYAGHAFASGCAMADAVRHDVIPAF